MIRVAINGYGNLGRGAEQAITKNKDMELVVVFTRRDPASVTTQGAPVAHVDDMAAWADKVDVCLNCGGSATDLIEQTPATAALFNTVDSFDTHARIPEHFAAVDAAAKASGHVALISAGWDPGLFSMLRVLGEAVLPDGATTTFWGPGVSQGHSDALRRIDGVVDAKQYTRPVEATVAAVKAGDDVELTTRSMHTRDCYVVAEEGADLARIEREIVEMPNYFADYDTTVTFLPAEELAAEHAGIPHGGSVIRRGHTSDGVAETVSFELQLGSNPEFTGSVLAATARAVARLAARGESGARTVFDVTLADLSAPTPEDLRAHSLGGGQPDASRRRLDVGGGTKNALSRGFRELRCHGISRSRQGGYLERDCRCSFCRQRAWSFGWCLACTARGPGATGQGLGALHEARGLGQYSQPLASASLPLRSGPTRKGSGRSRC